jgi:hypothetical protein
MQLTPRDKRMVQVLGVVAGLALLYFVFTTVLGGDGGGGEVASPPVDGGTSPSASPTVTPSPTPRETLPPVSLAGSRDPFSIPPGLELSTGGSVSPTTTVAPGATTTPAATTFPPPTTFPPVTTTSTFPPPPPPTTTTTPPPGGGGDGGEHPGNKILIGGHDVKLISVAGGGTELDVTVDGKLYTVEPGATFDDNFKLVKIDGKCATFLFGDQSFELCEK